METVGIALEKGKSPPFGSGITSDKEEKWKRKH